MPSRFSSLVAALLCASLLCPAAGLAAETPPAPQPDLSLREALARGLRANLDLQASALQIPAAKAGIQAVKGRFDPKLVGNAGAGSDRVPPAEEDIAGFDRYYQASVGLQKVFQTGLTGDLTLGAERLRDNSSIDILAPQNRTYLVLDLTQPLLRDFGTAVNTADVAIGKNALLQSEDRYLDRARQLGASIEATYLRLLRAQGALTLRIEARRLAANLLAGNRKKFAAGIVPINEVQEAETAVASRDEDVIAARQSLETAINDLLDLLEASGEDPLRSAPFTAEAIPSARAAAPGFTEALRQALDHRPDLAASRLAVAARNIRLRYTRNQMLPRLDLQGTLGLNGLSGDPTGVAASDHGGNFAGDSFDAADRMARGSGYQWFVGLRFSYPLGNRSAHARVEQAAVEKRQAILELKRQEDGVATEVRNALVAVGRSRERMQVADHFRQLAQTSLDQESTRLSDGLSDTFHILQFQNDLIAAQLSQLDARIDYQLGLAALYKAMGTNLARDGILLRLPAPPAGSIPVASD